VDLPRITLLVTVHNAAKYIHEKVVNSLELDYPMERLQILIASDGSTDDTDEAVSGYADRGVELVQLQPQAGKTVAQNAALQRCWGDIIVYSNGQTMLKSDSLKLIAHHFGDPRIGAVAASLNWENTEVSAIARSGGFYANYEQRLWRLESRLGLLAWAWGAFMAVRRDLVKPMPEVYGEDVILPLWVIAQVYRVVYEPAAIGTQRRRATPEAEYQARIRMTLRSLQGTLYAWPLRYIARFPALTWAIVSHKLLRWLTPYFMVVALVANLALLGHLLYLSLALLQAVFYMAALAGWATRERNIPIPGIGAAYSFCLTNWAFAVGVWRALRGEKIRIFSTREVPGE
jgi:cellulose synthase/poly-beta-1,6-N-acetylglucosamine synthase-like glycosyltransferase